MTQERQRVWLGSVVRVAVAGYGGLPGAQQAAIRARLEALSSAVTADVLEEERVVVDTDDGAALCFLGSPEDALFAALGLRERLRGETLGGSQPLGFRIGVTLGPVKMETAGNGRSRLVNAGRCQSRLVIDAARPGQIVASESFFEVTARAAPVYAPLFRRLEPATVSGEVGLSVYEVMAPGQAADPASAPAAPSTELIAYRTGWERAELTAAAIALAPYVGPRARTLVMEAAERATSVTHLYSLLAEALPTERDREAFRRAQGLV